METSLKFKCTNCDEYIYLKYTPRQYLKYMTTSDTAECKNCKQLNMVPKDAEVMSNDINLKQQVDQDRIAQNAVDPSDELQSIKIDGDTPQPNDNADAPINNQQIKTDESGGIGIEGGKPGQVYYIIGIITIIFGIFVGICLLVIFNQPVDLGIISSNAELALGEVAIALGVSMLFIVPGIICIGIAQIIELLDK